MNVLLSIKPEYANRIFAGEKRFEFRRVVPKQDVERVFVYASAPVQRIIGEFTVRTVVTSTPEKLWRRTHAHAGIAQEAFMRYFDGCAEAHALEVAEARLYEQPIDPRKRDDKFRPPQSFVYLDDLPA